MTYEVEQKFPVTDLDALESRLVRHGAQLHPPVLQRDRYFAHPARDFARTDEALRIRCVGQANYVTYKGPKVDRITKTRCEIELPLAPGPAEADRFAELLAALGFTAVAAVRKTRRPVTIAWQGWHVDGALDRVEGLGAFAELELCVGQAQVEAAKTAIRSLAAELGLSDAERRSYLELLLAAAR